MSGVNPNASYMQPIYDGADYVKQNVVVPGLRNIKKTTTVFAGVKNDESGFLKTIQVLRTGYEAICYFSNIPINSKLLSVSQAPDVQYGLAIFKLFNTIFGSVNNDSINNREKMHQTIKSDLIFIGKTNEEADKLSINVIKKLICFMVVFFSAEV